MGILLGQQAAVARLPGGGVILPVPDATVTVGADLRVADTRLGWTSVNGQRRDATTAAMLGQYATIANQHLLGFGTTTNPQPGAGAAYDWSGPAGMDFYYGYPTKASGYFAQVDELCITFCGCPPHMRVPKAGSGHTWDPMGDPSKPGTPNYDPTVLTSLSKYAFVHSDWHQEYADLCAAFMARYPWVRYCQPWNEFKLIWFGTQYPGSNLVPPGSGLPARAGSQRWWTEGYTALYNKIWTAVKAVRSDAFIVGPYHVYAGLSWESPQDWADDVFPDRLMGPWGYADKTVLSSLRYFIQFCTGLDALCVDIRNTCNDWKATRYYSPASMPGTPDPGNAWLGNPNGGTTPTFFLEGVANGPWNGGQISTDFRQWVRDLGASNAVYQRPQCDARTIPIAISEWYARVGVAESTPNPATGLFYPGGFATHAEMAAMFAWYYTYEIAIGTYYVLAWKPEGSIGQEGNRDNDPGCAHPLAVWNQYGTPLSLQPTELAPVCQGLIDNFPVGTQLKTVTSSNPLVRGIASTTTLMLISRSATPLTVLADGQNITLAGFEVKFLTRVTTLNPSGFVMPTTNPAGMTRVFADDFSTYPNIALGSFPAATSGRWGGYGAGTPDTRTSQSGAVGGIYDMGKTCSVVNGVLDIWLHNEMVGGVKKNWSAAPWPIIPGNQPFGIINGHDYGTPSNVQVRANIYYGQIEFAFRSSVAQGWKTAWLLWPDFAGNGRQNGEIDGPEGSLDGVDTIAWFMHWQDATLGSEQTARQSGVVYANNVWHVGKIVWGPNVCEFWMDGVKLGATITARVPANPMHWILQTEVVLAGAPDPTPPALGSEGHVQLDWIVMWQRDGIYP